MRILMTGATGFVGSPLVRELASREHEVWVLSRNPEQGEQSRNPERGEQQAGVSRAFRWDALVGPPPAEAFEGVDAVVNLAGSPVAVRWREPERKAIRRSRVQGTERLVAAMRELDEPPRALISASAIGYYGDRGDEELPEEAEPGSGFLAEVCKDWEAAALGAEKLGMRVARLRIGLVLHPAGGALGRMLPMHRKCLGGRLSSGTQWWPWIHRQDLVRLFRWAVEGDVEGPVNGTAPTPVPQKTFATVLNDVLGKSNFLPAPAFALRVALGGFAQELLHSRRCVPRAAAEAGFSFRHASLEPALEELLEEKTS